VAAGLTTIAAEFTWLAGRFERGVRLDVGADGRIARVTRSSEPPDRKLTGRALLPGFVNVHSHAFQRALRGRGELFPPAMGDFWSWREAMYRLVEELTAAELKAVCRLAFDEMLACGITTVGEFHYLHHDDPLRRDFAFDDVVLEAAAESGIRIAMLLSYYKTGGVGKPLAGGQRRFDTPDLAEYWRQFDRLARRLRPPLQTIGVAPHSMRAVPEADLRALCREAAARGLVVHIHVEEQRQEIEEVRAAYGTNPLRWMLDNLALDERFTIIHSTHTTPRDAAEFVAAGGRVCYCPLTEGNLGDGLAPHTPATVTTPGAVCVGTDSNVRLDFCEELRWLEFAQRLRLERRGALKTSDGRVAPLLLECGTRNGALALGLDGGEIAPGRPADFFTIDLNHVSLRGFAVENLLDVLLLGAGREAIDGACVNGVWRRG
jgi:formimidoylglutamate deiminase